MALLARGTRAVRLPPCSKTLWTGSCARSSTLRTQLAIQCATPLVLTQTELSGAGRHLAELARSLSTTRTETDAFGPLEVESSRLWGAQTQRSIGNFPIGGPESKMPLQVIRAFGVLKKCAAKYNMDAGK